jgi:segregation and condensation protein A
MERKIPWWRKVVDFALSGFKIGFGLFRKNGRVEASAESGESDQSSAEVSGEVEPETEVVDPRAEAGEIEMSATGLEETHELKEPEEEIALKDTSPQNESGEAEARQELETPLAQDAAPAAEPLEETLTPAFKTSEEGPIGTVAKDPSAEGEAPPENAAVEVTEQLEAPEQPAEAAVPLAVKAAQPPSETKPAAERTTAEKVAAALKARGETDEQSPFSVFVGEVYDGPLDLLLDLIRKQDIDVYDIPIAKITAQFLAYVEHLRASDMDVAGEFIYTAALLIHIKSKMLLPRAPAGPDDAGEDPRRELVERLLEHERFKNAAQMLHDRQMLEAATWTNPGVREFREDVNAEPEIAADTTDLVRVFRDILDRARNRPIINVEEDTVTVGQMIQFLARRLTMEDKPVALRRLLSHTHSERALIAMFLALLELVRLQAILLRQDRHFSEIFIKKHAGFEAAMNQGLIEVRDDWR